VAFAFLIHHTYLSADELFSIFELLRCHEFLFEIVRVVHCEAGYISRISAASAWLLSHSITGLTRTRVTRLLALMESTW
jgi:hypothetical protein